jgi:hypothetical protein
MTIVTNYIQSTGRGATSELAGLEALMPLQSFRDLAFSSLSQFRMMAFATLSVQCLDHASVKGMYCAGLPAPYFVMPAETFKILLQYSRK